MGRGALAVGQREEQARRSGRFARIKRELLSHKVHLCPERALLVTEYFKHHDDPRQPMIVRKARALRYVLENKSINIYPDELIVGNPGSHRISALMQPELAGVFMSEDILWIDRRKTNPLVISWPDRLKLMFKVFPFWLFRNMPFRAFYPHFGHLLRYVMEQLNATYYLINEAGGIGHFLPNYEKMLKLGVEGYLELMEGKDSVFRRAARIASEGLVNYAKRTSRAALEMAAREKDPSRAMELKDIARVCNNVPLKPARTFHEALQSLWFTHMALELEGLNSAISFGRIDQYLYPYYKADLEAGRITPDDARELLLSFSAKTTEHVFLLSERTSQYHGGYLVVQAAIVGGMDKQGSDAVNDLTYLFLDVMEEAGLRDPNYQARIHEGSPDEYLSRVVEVAKKGDGVPAVFSDEAAIRSLVNQGYPIEDARNYGVVGCVEFSIPGKSFLSTDAGLFNLPLCLELALNSGKRIKGWRRIGAKTPDPLSFTSMEQVVNAFRDQVEYMVSRMVDDIQVIERGNRDYHPTPLQSMLVDGCIEKDMDLTAGGAVYNSSGIQGVGVADVADSLAAIDEVVFKKRKYAMKQVIDAVHDNFASYPEVRAELLKAPKFGNDNPMVDGYARLVAGIFYDALTRHQNTRGGPYVPGFYSVTCHVAFGQRTGALPSGRLSGEPFASSLGAANGRDRLGPTALLNSVARIEPELAPNGYALNLRFDKRVLEGDRGKNILKGLVRGFFSSGGMEMQFNVLDPDILEDAIKNPGKYPGLVVRVSGYLAYFDDLPYAAKREIAARTRLEA